VAFSNAVAKLEAKARRSLFTQTLQKRRMSFSFVLLKMPLEVDQQNMLVPLEV